MGGLAVRPGAISFRVAAFAAVVLGYGCALIAGVEEGELASTVSGGAGGAGTSSGTEPIGGGGTTSSGGAGSGAAGTGGSASAYRALVIADGAIGYWRLGEAIGPAAVDASGSGYDGLYNGASIALGEAGALVGDPDTAAAFPGNATGFVDMGDVLDFTNRAAFSLELWAKPTAADGAIAGKLAHDATNGYRGYAISIPSDPLVFYFRRNGVTVSAPVTLPASDYAHLVGTYDGYVVRLYVDGTLVDSQDSTENVDDIPESFLIGESTNWGPYNGAVDEVAAYDFQLTAAQISAHHRTGLGR